MHSFLLCRLLPCFGFFIAFSFVKKGYERVDFKLLLIHRFDVKEDQRGPVVRSWESLTWFRGWVVCSTVVMGILQVLDTSVHVCWL